MARAYFSPVFAMTTPSLVVLKAVAQVSEHRTAEEHYKAVGCADPTLAP